MWCFASSVPYICDLSTAASRGLPCIALFLAGAALVRACEHGHLSLRLVVQGWLGLASAGSIALCGAGVLLSLCAVASLRLCLATLVRSMPQCALLAFPVCIMHVLSRG